ncbi:hypothetical protein [Kocuria sp. CNJ-770]|uniref:hypothetical protein n=1 Tax=Kocuria sp. CNJ-770 TaxID=1904964 RepID=UPI00130175C4|nr:hypothetical protein [Kocuria sp. CNJ-770]
MSKKPHARPWVWNRHTDKASRGVLIYNSRAGVFIPQDRITEISDALIDILETYEREQK